MNAVMAYFRELRAAVRDGWNQFWFTPDQPHTLAMIRIFTGGMLLYTHAVWSVDLMGFFGRDGRLAPEFVRDFHGSWAAWSHFYWVDSPWLLWLIHAVALVVFALLMLGWRTNWTAPLSFLLATSYANRAVGALFGLDQINIMLSLYLVVGDAGGAYAWDRRRRGANVATVRTNIAIRLIQVHMCVIYFFAAIGKLQGNSWWDGWAMWRALANYEYQSIDMTWLVHAPLLIQLLTHVSLLWELSYCVLVWPRLTRPLVLALAVPLHGGIAACLGMITFGLIMLTGNLAFVPSAAMRSVVKWVKSTFMRGGNPTEQVRAGGYS